MDEFFIHLSMIVMIRCVVTTVSLCHRLSLTLMLSVSSAELDWPDISWSRPRLHHRPGLSGTGAGGLSQTG